jgi:hypothetical protein
MVANPLRYAILVIVFVLLVMADRKAKRRILSSLKLTVVLLVLLALGSAAGTMVYQGIEREQSLEKYGPLWDGVFRVLGMYDVYHAPWFTLLLTVLAANAASCLLRGMSLRLRRLGWTLTHVSILVILAGGIVSSVGGISGQMHLAEGETSSTVSSRSGGTFDLPFSITLDDFEVERDSEPHETLVVEERRPRTRSAPVLVGQEMKLLGITATVKNKYAHAELTHLVVSRSESDANPAVRVKLSREGDNIERWLYAESERPPVEQFGMRIEFSSYESRESLEAARKSALARRDEPTMPESLVISDGEQEWTVPAVVGAEGQLSGLETTVKVLRYVPDFVILDTETREVGTRSDKPNNPAVLVEIEGAESWVFAKFPDFTMGHGEPSKYKMRYVRSDSSSENGAALSVMHSVQEDSFEIVYTDAEIARSLDSLNIGQSREIEGKDVTVALLEYIGDAGVVLELAPSANHGAPPGVQLDVRGPDGTARSVGILANARPILISDDAALSYRREFPITQYTSRVSLADDEGGNISGEVRVNAPLKHKGYVFYQVSYDQKAERWTGLEVKRDPGIPVVYVGFIGHAAGLIMLFYVNPALKRRRNAG